MHIKDQNVYYCCVIASFNESHTVDNQVKEVCQGTVKKLQKYDVPYSYNFPIKMFTILKQEGFLEDLSNRGVNIYKPREMGTTLRNIRLEKLNLLSSNDQKDIATIPLEAYFIWFTSPDNPKEISEIHINNIMNNIKILNLKSKWKFHFWTNDKKLIPYTSECLKNAGVIVHELNEFAFTNTNLECIFLNAIAKKYWGQASDLFRLLLLENGGFYFDIDQRFFKVIDKIRETYDFFAGYEKHPFHYISNSVIAAKPHHIIIKMSLKSLERNMILSDDTPDYAANPMNVMAQTVACTGPGMFSAMVYKYANSVECNDDIVFDPYVFFSDKQNMDYPNPEQEDYHIPPIMGYQDFNTTWL